MIVVVDGRSTSSEKVMTHSDWCLIYDYWHSWSTGAIQSLPAIRFFPSRDTQATSSAGRSVYGVDIWDSLTASYMKFLSNNYESLE
jgi:hypothetical protein